jgi:hypothetical protein
VTAATDSATAAQDGRRVSATVRHAAELRSAAAGLETAARPVPTGLAATPATLAKAGRTVVPAARPEAEIRTASSDSATTSRTAGCRPLPQAAPLALAGGRDTSDHGAPGSATPVEAGPECAAVAYVEALDGSERKLLLTHIAQAWPEVVEAGAELVAQWRAEAAEHRRKRLRRNEHDRRRRRRAETGETWPPRG